MGLFFPSSHTPAVVQFPLHSSSSCTPVSFRHVALFSPELPTPILLSSPHLAGISTGADTHGSDRREAVRRRLKCASGKFSPQPKTACPKARPQQYCHLAQLGVWTGGCSGIAVPEGMIWKVKVKEKTTERYKTSLKDRVQIGGVS